MQAGQSLQNRGKSGGKSPVKGLSGEVSRYFLVSLLALAVDYGLLVLIHQIIGIELLIANAISFSSGAIVAYLGSVFWVFRHRALERPRNEFLVFFVIGLGGLLINEGVLWAFASVGEISYQISKIFAAGSSFIFNFVVRKWLLFRENSNPAASAS